MSNRTDPRTPRARRLRHETTLQEGRLWAAPRQIEWPGGGDFRRQVPIGPYYADFAHHGLKLVVELDGSQHSSDDGVRRDGARTAYLEAAGYRVQRFWNAEVVTNFDGVVETILAKAAGTPPTPVRAARDSALPAASGGRVGLGVALSAAFIAWLLAAPALATEQRAIGPWTLKWGAQSDGSAYCTVELSESGRTAGLQIVKGRHRFFGLRNPVWKWTPRQSYQVKLSVDGDAVSWSGPAAAALPDTLVMSVAADPDPIAALEAGRSLTLEIRGVPTAYSLADFPPAAAALRQCLAEAG